LGFLSLVDIACKRFEARGDMDMVIGFPESSFRGFKMGCAGFADERSEVVASVRRGPRCVKALDAGVCGTNEGLDDCLNADGAGKSRYSDLGVAAVVALLYALKLLEMALAG
jgi:hypothetical protein